MTDPTVTYEVENGVAWISLNRPDKYNAIDMDTAHRLRDAMLRLGEDDDAHCGVLRGAGRGFCAGGDISMFPNIDTASGFEFTRRLGKSIYMARERLHKPLIAAVHGQCIAGGLELALTCHMVFASAEARFGVPEINLGLIPGWGGTVRLGQLLPLGLATDMLLTGRRLDAASALRHGLVSRVFDDPEGLFAETKTIAEGIAGRSSTAVELALEIARAASGGGEGSLYALEQVSTAILFGSPEAQQAIQTTLSKGIGK